LQQKNHELDFILEKTADSLEKLKVCPGCAERPAAIKTDDEDNCFAICDIGMVEYIRDLQEKHKISERKAVQSFIEIVRTNLPDDDPVLDKMTEGSIRSKLRRETGKDQKKVLAQSEPKSESAKSEQKSKQHLCVATVEGVAAFLKKYLPGYKIVRENV
jgi:hypothetical protein